MNRRITPTLALIMAGGLAAGIGLARPSASTAPVPAATGVVIKDFAFSPGIVVAAGQPVTVTNDDSAAHTLTFDSGEVDTGTLDQGGSATFNAPTAPGEYTFFCSIHPFMQGHLVVQG